MISQIQLSKNIAPGDSLRSNTPTKSTNVHVQRPPAVTLNESPEEIQYFHWTMPEDLNQIYYGRSGHES